MSDTALATEHKQCFQLKTSFSPCTILQLTRYDLDELTQQLSAAINKAPNFFIGSPVIIDLDGIKHLGELDFARIKRILIDHNLVPMGVRGGSDEQNQAAVDLGIPKVAAGKAKPVAQEVTDEAPVVQEVISAEPQKLQKAAYSAKLITTPIRSGMQVYAKDTDLIVNAPVSAGAELMADGNIHVYGPLRGRALAGVQGDTQARIFCRTLEAELVAIAGYYLVKEEIQALSLKDAAVQIYLEKEQVKIAKI